MLFKFTITTPESPLVYRKVLATRHFESMIQMKGNDNCWTLHKSVQILQCLNIIILLSFVVVQSFANYGEKVVCFPGCLAVPGEGWHHPAYLRLSSPNRQTAPKAHFFKPHSVSCKSIILLIRNRVDTSQQILRQI